MPTFTQTLIFQVNNAFFFFFFLLLKTIVVSNDVKAVITKITLEKKTMLLTVYILYVFFFPSIREENIMLTFLWTLKTFSRYTLSRYTNQL